MKKTTITYYPYDLTNVRSKVAMIGFANPQQRKKDT